MHSPHCKSLLSHAATALFAVVSTAGAAEPAKSSECAKIGICYCVSSEVKPAIEEKIARFRALIAEQHKAGKSVGYLSVPLSPAGGGFFNLNAEVAEKAKQRSKSASVPTSSGCLIPGCGWFAACSLQALELRS